MRVLVAGSRSVTHYGTVALAIEESGYEPTVILSGGARGVDRLGERWARQNGVRVERFPADWRRHGKSAGFIRNREMVEECDVVIAVWDGRSRGTAHTIRLAAEYGRQLHVVRVETREGA